MLEMALLDKEQIVSHRRSTTFSNVAKTSLRNPRFRISFHICSMGFISGVYGGMWKRIIFSGNSNPPSPTSSAPISVRSFSIFGENVRFCPLKSWMFQRWIPFDHNRDHNGGIFVVRFMPLSTLHRTDELCHSLGTLPLHAGCGMGVGCQCE